MLNILVAIALTQMGTLVAAESASGVMPQPKDIKAYCIDFNWGPGGPNGFARPGLWADADPAKHVAWYRAMGVHVIQTFCVLCNGYAWYKNGVVPEQPGLKHDFLRDVVAHDRVVVDDHYFDRFGNHHMLLTLPHCPAR